MAPGMSLAWIVADCTNATTIIKRLATTLLILFFRLIISILVFPAYFLTSASFRLSTTITNLFFIENIEQFLRNALRISLKRIRVESINRAIKIRVSLWFGAVGVV